MIIDRRQLERIARAIHERYLADRIRSGSAMGSAPAMTPWENLDEPGRDVVRAQAADIEAKLARIGCAVGTQDRADREFQFTEAELYLLARVEQQRWLGHRRATGWVYGDRHDTAAMTHPSMVSWDELPEMQRDKDREAVRHIPAVLAEVDLGIIRRRTVDP